MIEFLKKMSEHTLEIVLYTEGLPFTGDTLDHQSLGGSETAFIYVARELAQLGHHVTAYCLCSKEGVFDGVNYKHISGIHELERRECDLFICSRYFFVFTKNIRAKVKFLWMHDMLVPELAGHLRNLLPAIDAVYCLSDYHCNIIAQAVPEAGLKMHKLMNGIDPSFVRESIADVTEKRHKVMFTSRPERGLWSALEQYEQVGDTNLELLVCSYTSFQSDELKALEDRFRQRIASLVERGFPVSTGNFVKRELYRHIAESKAVIYPTDFPEIFCISAIEAQACGTVFLTTNDFALTETVGYERIALGDAAGFQERLRAILSDANLRRELEQKGLEHAAPYTWQRVARAFIKDAEHRLRPAAEASTEQLKFFNLVGRRAPGYSLYLAKLHRQNALSLPVDTEERRALRASEKAARILARYDKERASRMDRQADSLEIQGVESLPKISCLTVTLNRLNLLKQSIRCYCDQTYPNRELVIVSDGDARYRSAIEDYLRWLGRSDIKLLFLNGERYTLGQLRNISIAEATGQIVCQWDDDDYNHPERLMVQARLMLKEKTRASFMSDQLQFFHGERSLYWIDWAGGQPVDSMWQLLPGTMMMFKDERFRYPEIGDYAERGEDTSLLADICDTLPVTCLQDHGYLYVYAYHGRNTFGEDHHQALRESSLPVEHLLKRESLLRKALSYYPFSRPFTVYSREHPAFIVTD
jgi:glycosyltransferase involved in cell wall biosynthesis